MSTLGKIVYLSEAQASELFANGSITVDGSTITYSADDLYLTPENIEYVKKSGDTMTGALNMTVARIYNASYPSVAFRTAENGSNIASIGVGTNDNTMAFIEKSPNASHSENYYLPSPDAGLTADKYYNIVTTKGSYTLSGRLIAPGYTTKSTNGYPNIYFQNNGADTGYITHENATRRFIFSEYPTDSSSYYEAFMIPAPSTGLTANQYYTILTTRDHPSYTVQTLDWSSSNYINANYDVWVEKALDTVRFQGLFTFTNLTANTTVEIGTLPVGYRPNNRIERTIGITMNASWNSPGTMGAQFVLVSVYSNGIVKINPGSTPNTNSFWIDMTWCVA